jgi:hypothetical protein
MIEIKDLHEPLAATTIFGGSLGALATLGPVLPAAGLKYTSTVSPSPLPTDENVGSKKWLCSNFKLEVDGLPCNRVAKIDSFNWEQKVVNP